MNKSMILAVLAVAVLSSSVFGADDRASQARAVFNANKDAVVWVTATEKIEVSGGGQTAPAREQKAQTMGTVIDAGGMTVVSLANFDMAVRIDGQVMQNGVKLSAKSEISDVKIVLPPSKANPNGLEIPARVAMKDADLDLAFIMPDETAKDKPAQFPFVKLQAMPKLEVLADLVCVARLGKALDQEPVASIGEVSAVVTKPQTLVFGGKFVGGPVFTLDGKVVGITVLYKTEGSQVTAILPAEEVQKVADQAKEAKPAPASAPAATSKPAP